VRSENVTRTLAKAGGGRVHQDEVGRSLQGDKRRDQKIVVEIDPFLDNDRLRVA